MTDTTGSIRGWDGSVDSLSDDTLVSVRLGDIRNPRRESDLLLEYMRFIGNTGKHIMVRYDPLRDYNGKYFTVVIYDPELPASHVYRNWRFDTENPVEVIRMYIREVMGYYDTV